MTGAPYASGAAWQIEEFVRSRKAADAICEAYLSNLRRFDRMCYELFPGCGGLTQGMVDAWFRFKFNVTIQYDFDRGIERKRFESFCYGPLTCKNYKMGPARSVPYKGFSGVKDEGWLDEICVQWRSGGDE